MEADNKKHFVENDVQVSLPATLLSLYYPEFRLLMKISFNEMRNE